MEISCDECEKRYRIDESRIKGDQVRLRCRQCGHIMLVRNPRAAAVEAPPPMEVPPAGAAAAADPLAAAPVQVRFGLVSKVILLMLAISLIPFGTFWFMTFRESGNRIRQSTTVMMAETAEGLGRQVDEWIDKNVRVLAAAARMPQIRGMRRAEQEPTLEAVADAYPWMYLVFTVDPQGMNLARSDGEALRDYSDRDYYRQALRGREVAWQTLVGKTSGKPALVLAVPIREGERIVGVLAAAMTLDDISKRLARWRRGASGYAFLVDETGKVVAHQVPRYVTAQRSLEDHPLVAAYRATGRPRALSFTDAQGVPHRGYVRGNRLGWVLGTQQAESEVLAPLDRTQRSALILLAVTVLAVALVAWLAARALVRPITRLTVMADRMSMGELEVKVDVRSRDELAQLAAAITRMQTSLRMALDRLRRN